MADKLKLNRPWLVAVWPGMGHVALNAGYYLLSQLGMDVAAELDAGELFDIDHVEVKAGMIQPARRPRNRFFVWVDPEHEHDLLVFLGEAQPPIGKFPFCRQLVSYAKQVGVERVLTFAAMATRMRPDDRSRVFGAATDDDILESLKNLDLELVNEGQIGGLNGVLLGAAAEVGLPGACLLGEMPHVFTQLPFPKASQAVLEVFCTMSGIEIDFTELTEQAANIERQLGQLLALAEGNEEVVDEEELPMPESVVEGGLTADDERRIEGLFEQALKQRSKAFELKQELDRLGAFKVYEDRFLDLFKKAT
jgi:proteasome assembly chaperone (PAC2) family protein